MQPLSSFTFPFRAKVDGPLRQVETYFYDALSHEKPVKANQRVQSAKVIQVFVVVSPPFHVKIALTVQRSISQVSSRRGTHRMQPSYAVAAADRLSNNRQDLLKCKDSLVLSFMLLKLNAGRPRRPPTLIMLECTVRNLLHWQAIKCNILALTIAHTMSWKAMTKSCMSASFPGSSALMLDSYRR